MTDDVLLRCSVRNCDGTRSLRAGESLATSWSWVCSRHIGTEQRSRLVTAKPTAVAQVSRPVTARCVVCESKFKPTRRDARYCSSRCRQRAARSRVGVDDLARQIDEARARYWQLVQQYAEARGVRPSQANDAIVQTVTADGHVYIGGRLVGQTTSTQLGWGAWGLEAAPPPFLPPTEWADSTYGRAAIDRAPKHATDTTGVDGD
jgi:hypothetical protein